MLPRAPLLAAFALLTAACSDDARPFAPWGRSVDTTSTQIHGLGVDSTGAVTVSGGFAEQLDLGAGSMSSLGGQDLFVARLDAAGKAAWSSRTGDDGDQTAAALAVTPAGDAFVAGNFSGEMDFSGTKLSAVARAGFLVHVDPQGHVLWAKQLGKGVEGAVNVTAVAVDADGSAVVGGSFLGELDLGGGALVAKLAEASFVARFDAAGQHVFSLRLAGGSNAVTALALGADGSVAVGGNFSGSVGIDAKLQVAAVPSAFVARLAPTGEPQFLGTLGDPQPEYSTTEAAVPSAFVARLAPTGEPQFLGTLGDPQPEYSTTDLSGVAFDGQGDLVATGGFANRTAFGFQPVNAAGGGHEVYVASYSAGGAPLWIHHFGPAYATGQLIAASPGGDVFVAGSFFGDELDVAGHTLRSAPQFPSSFLLRMTPAGVVTTALTPSLGPYDSSTVTALGVDPAGGVVLAGTYTGDLTFGAQTLTSGSEGSLFVAAIPMP